MRENGVGFRSIYEVSNQCATPPTTQFALETPFMMSSITKSTGPELFDGFWMT